MRWSIRSIARFFLVSIGIIALTSLSIDAFDTATGTRSTMLAQLLPGNGSNDLCPEGMRHVPTATNFTCVDAYEVSPGKACPQPAVQSPRDSRANLAAEDCLPHSTAEAQPWTYITREQAATMCARRGARLPNAAEWYRFALGSDGNEAVCVTEQSAAAVTGSRPECVSSVGAHDAVGNVWEWVEDDVFAGTYNDRPLPRSGYVAQVDKGGVPVTTAGEPTAAYNSDYFWSESEGAYGMIRGGFYGSRSDAGIYTVHARTNPNDATGGIGFRCVQ